YPIIDVATLAAFNAFIMCIPTRDGNFPGVPCAFWDRTSTLCATGGLAGKYAATFVSTASSGGGQATTRSALSLAMARLGATWTPLTISRK
ncbi:flavoprotein-like protein, partial [Mycena epipterygia]